MNLSGALRSARAVVMALLFAVTISAPAQSREYWGCYVQTLDGAQPVLVLTCTTATTAFVTVAGGMATVYNLTPAFQTEVTLPVTVMPTRDETPIQQSVHVTAGAPIQAILVIQHTGLGEATRLLPVEALGNNYMVLAYPNSEFARSECAVLATVDGTRLSITPMARTVGGLDSGMTNAAPIVLDAGEMYLVQAELSGNITRDLTGTQISADKPVAVFGGQEWVKIPDKMLAFNPLFEQIPPLSAWGGAFCVVPFARRTGGDVVRITAVNDSTDVRIGVGPRVRLEKGGTYEVILDSVTTITATLPVGIAQFSHSYEYDGRPNQFGDPFMTIVAPLSSGMTQATIVALGPAIYATNFVNIVALDTVSPVLLDNVDVNTLAECRNTVGGMKAYSVHLAGGRHVLSCVNPFLATVYGDTSYDGYGYTVAGVNVPPVDTIPPIARLSGECDTGMVIAITDSGVPISGIDSVIVVTAANCTVVVPPFVRCSPSVTVTAAMISFGAPASFTLILRDCAGNTSSYSHQCAAMPDTLPPDTTVSGNCGAGFQIVCRDSGRLETGIRSVSVAQATNVNIAIPAFTGCPASVIVTMTVVDPSLSASCALLVTDCNGNTTRVGRLCSVIGPETLLIAIDSAHGLPGVEVSVPITLVAPPVSYAPTLVEFTMQYDPVVALFRGFDKQNTLSSSFALTSQETVRGFVSAQFAGGQITTAGVLTRARFLLLAGPRMRSALVLPDSGLRFSAVGPYPAGRVLNIGALTVDSICGWHAVSTGSSLTMHVSPNPASGDIQITFDGSSEAVRVRVLSTLGSIVEERVIPPSSEGTRGMTISAPMLHAGAYAVQASTISDHVRQLVVIVR